MFEVEDLVSSDGISKKYSSKYNGLVVGRHALEGDAIPLLELLSEHGSGLAGGRAAEEACLGVCNGLQRHHCAGGTSRLVHCIFPQKAEAVLQHLRGLEGFLDLHLAHARLHIFSWRPLIMAVKNSVNTILPYHDHLEI